MSRIDGREFARTAGCLSGRLLGQDAPRLEQLGWQVGAIEFTLRGRTDAHGRSWLDLEAAGALATTCQRCLQPLEHGVHFVRELELADSVAQIEATDDDVDRVVAGTAMDVTALVEDEVILELPMVGRHEQCDAIQSAARAAPAEEEGAAASTLKGALAAWKSQGGKGRPH